MVGSRTTPHGTLFEGNGALSEVHLYGLKKRDVVAARGEIVP
jgi:hypothetical protein